jgi:hypothetical protein
LSRLIRLRWPQLNITVQASLLDLQVPALTADLWASFPIQSIQTHAAVAGKQIYFPSRLLLPDPSSAYTEPMNEQPPGRINLEPFFQYVSLNYGPVSEAVPAWPIAQVAEADIPRLAELGKLVWDNLTTRGAPLLVIVERADTAPLDMQLDQHTAAHTTVIKPSPDTTWMQVLAHLEAETAAIWLREPEDVRALRLGVIGSDAGVYGQYFSPWIMVTGLVRSLAVVELASLVRLSNNPTFSPGQLTIFLREMLALSLGVIGYFGLPRLGASLQAVNDTVSQIENRDDFKRFLAGLLTYVNRYNLWLHQTFPWHLGTLFPKPDPNDSRFIVAMSAHPMYAKH